MRRDHGPGATPERGAETIEFLAVFPFLLLLAMLVWQMALAGYTTVASESAAEQAARAAALGGSSAQVTRAAAQASPSWDAAERIVTVRKNADGSITATVRLRVPSAGLALTGARVDILPMVGSSVTMSAETGS